MEYRRFSVTLNQSDAQEKKNIIVLPYAFCTAPMPEKGSKVRLGFGTEDALEGTAAVNVRKNSGSLPQYRERELMTAAGKKVELHPSGLAFQGGGGRAVLTDGTGLSLGSSGPFVLCARGKVQLNASEISATTPLEINMFRSEAGSRERGGVVMPRGTGSNPPTGGSDSGFTMSFEFNGLSRSGVLCGEDFIRYRPFKDSPEEILVEEEFDWGALWGNVAAGLAIVTVVTGAVAYCATVAFTGGASAVFAPYVMGGLTAVGGSWLVVSQAEKDYARGEVSGTMAYINSGLAGSASGALAGYAFCMAPYAAPTLLYGTGAGYVGSMVGISEETMLNLTEAALAAVNLSNILVKGSDMVESTTGKNALKDALGEDAYRLVGQVSEKGAGLTLIAGLSNPDYYVKNNQVAHFEQVPRVGEGGSGERLIPGMEGVVTGGDSTKLGKNMMESMGLPRGTNWTGHQAQHIIPAETANHPVLQRVGMDLDNASNGLFLRTPADDISAMSRHRGYHSIYNEFVKTQLDAMDISQNVDVLQKQVYDLQQNLKYLQQSGLPLYPSQGATVDLWQRSLERIQ